MHHYVYLGVPDKIFHDVHRSRTTIVGTDNQVKANVMKHGDNASGHPPQIGDKVLNYFNDQLESERAEDVGKAKLAVFYIVRGESDAAIVQACFPLIYLVPIEWVLDERSTATINRSKEELIQLLRQKTLQVRHAQKLLETEFTGQRQKTPWLLPLKNFRSKTFGRQLDRLQAELIQPTNDPDRMTVLTQNRKQFIHNHSANSDQKGHSSGPEYFVDSSKLKFKPPGHELHGYHQIGGAGHSSKCAISSRRRLGVPYHRAFHYDCTFDNGPTNAKLANCHRDEKKKVSTNKNINIYPSDYIRPDAK